MSASRNFHPLCDGCERRSYPFGFWAGFWAQAGRSNDMVEADKVGGSISECLRRSNPTERQWVGEPSSGIRTLRHTAVIPQNSNDAKKAQLPKKQASLGAISPQTSSLGI
jgi:hypothetical protein